MLGVLSLFTDYANWKRAATVHTFTGPEPWQVSERELASWYIVGLDEPGHVHALFKAWHTAIVKGQAQPLLPGDHFVVPDIPYPFPIRKIPKKPLTAKQRRAKYEWELEQYRPTKKEPGGRAGPFTPPALDRPLLIQHDCLTCHRSDGTHASSCWRSR